MSNGVELIIASEKVKHVEKQVSSHHSQTVSLAQSAQKPLTLAPSTLKNQMILAIPSSKQDKLTIPINDNQFITKTCLTTYTYRTTYLENGSTTVESKERVISNRHTEERNYLRASSILPTDVTLTRTPQLVVGVFPTTYHYYNTIMDMERGEPEPLVITSKYTVINTVTGPEDYISYLQPSEEATPTQDTNTYFSRITLTRTIQEESDAPSIVSSENILTQVIITESLPARGATTHTALMTREEHNDLHIYATKTFLTTFTFYTTLVDSNQVDRMTALGNEIAELTPSIHTRVIENIVTDTVASSLLRPELISKFRTELVQKKGKVIVTMATLLGGQTLQVTAVKILKDSPTKSAATKQSVDFKSKTKNSVKVKSNVPPSPVDLRPSSVSLKSVVKKTQHHSASAIPGDLSLSESENKDVYVKPSQDFKPLTQSGPVQQLIGNFDLKRLRPMLNAMADLLQKNLVKRPLQEPSGQTPIRQNQDANAQLSAQSSATKNVTTSSNVERPVYIPLQINGNGQIGSTQSPIDSYPQTSASGGVNKLTAHSLHIHPPLELPNLAGDDTWLLQAPKNVSHYRHSLSSAEAYQASLLNNGISIRPGEIITANADVIIGRPSGIDFRSEEGNGSLSFSDHTQHSSAPLKKKMSHPSIPLLLPPPQIQARPYPIPLVSTSTHERLNSYRGAIDNYDNILKPPPPVPTISSHSVTPSQSSKYLLRHPMPLLSPSPPIPVPGPGPNFRSRFPPQMQKEIAGGYGNHIYGSPQIANLNSELNNNEILEIRQIPEIFSTSLPALTSYPHLGSNHYYYKPFLQTPVQQLKPTVTYRSLPAASTFSALLKKDVLSHTVNMHAPPLTFKKESENFPNPTAVQGHVAHMPMPLIKIPLHEANVEVRLTPQNNRVVLVPSDQPHSTTAFYSSSGLAGGTLKKRNQNVVLDLDSSSNGLAARPGIKLNWSHFPSSSDDEFTDLSASDTRKTHLIQSPVVNSDRNIPIHELIHKNSEVFSTEQDQKTAYTSYALHISNLSSPIPESSEREADKPNSNTNYWLSVIKEKEGYRGQPFTARNRTDSHKKVSLMSQSDAHKIFVAKGEHFHLRPYTEPSQKQTTEAPSAASVSPTQSNSDFATQLLPPAPPISLDSLPQKTTAKYVFGLQPPLPSATSTDPNTYSTLSKPLATSISLGTRVTSPSSSSAIPFRHSAPPRPPQTKKTSTINASRPRNSWLQTLKEKIEKLEPSEIPEPSLTHGQNNSEYVTPTGVYTNKQPSSILTLRPTSTKKHHDNDLPTTLPPSKNVDRKQSVFSSPNKIALESSELGVVDMSTGAGASIILRTSSAVGTNLTSSVTNSLVHKTDSLLSEPSYVAPTLKIAASPKQSQRNSSPKVSEMAIHKSLPSSPLESRSKVAKNRNQSQKSFVAFSPSPTTPIVATSLHKSTLPKQAIQVVIESVGKATVDVHHLRPNAKNTNYKSVDLPKAPTPNRAESDSVDSVHVGFYPDILPDYGFENAARDEEILPAIDSNSVLLGGVLIETSPKTHYVRNATTAQNNACIPACKSSKNEICTTLTFGSESESHCDCRPGFARMFPDRPCKPTYTYELQIETSRVGNYLLKFSDALRSNSSTEYRHLSSIILDAVDRMIMQSDFRDVYHGVQLRSFSPDQDDAVTGSFLLQLSENSDERRLENVFKKYLRQSNFSIGGTELYTSKKGINLLSIRDFDECSHAEFNDCSANAHCFNLVGSYTCSCNDGFVDVSENAVYSGRQCSDSIIGCDKCNYHGKCLAPPAGKMERNETATTVCRCFAWHAGATCQLNLKILLICLIAIGTVLLILLLFCILLMYIRRRNYGGNTASPIFITASTIHPSMLSSSGKKSRLSASLIERSSIDKHAILNDSSSETSHSSASYLHKDSMDGNVRKEKTKPVAFTHSNVIHKYKNKQLRNNYDALAPRESAAEQPHASRSILTTGHVVVDPEQADRSLTFMIPRAKYYHPSVFQHSQLMQHHQITMAKQCNNLESPFASQADFSTFTDKSKQIKMAPGLGPGPASKDCTVPISALVSAGFEVSAIVSDHVGGSGSATTADTLDAHGSEARSNGARSFDETTVQAVTKSMNLNFDMQAESHTNEEANTMAERDLGSTFLLPHTHLYKPDKMESDMSGFDSI